MVILFYYCPVKASGLILKFIYIFPLQIQKLINLSYESH